MNTIYTYKPQSQNRAQKQKQEEQKRKNRLASVQMILALVLFALTDWFLVLGLLGE